MRKTVNLKVAHTHETELFDKEYKFRYASLVRNDDTHYDKEKNSLIITGFHKPEDEEKNFLVFGPSVVLEIKPDELEYFEFEISKFRIRELIEQHLKTINGTQQNFLAKLFLKLSLIFLSKEIKNV